MAAIKAYFIRDKKVRFLQQVDGRFEIYETKESAIRKFKRLHKDDQSRCEVTVAIMDVGVGTPIFPFTE